MSVSVVLLHPGQMGVSVGQALRDNGHRVASVSQGRGTATIARAEQAGFAIVDSLNAALAEADAVVSVCPPHAAEDVARAVKAGGFAGTYVDANAIAPETAMAIAALTGGGFVDGGIIGPPAHVEGTTRLYLSGDRAAQVAAWFEGSKFGVEVIGPVAGAASALKMCYAAYTKGTSALLLAIRALATHHGVDAALLAEWEISQKGLTERSQATAQAVAPKAWRFVGEMEEIARTFDSAGLAGDFHRGAAKTYACLRALKDAEHASLDDVIAAMRK